MTSHAALDGLVVLVTGGASGIGLATARLARAEGARVVVADLARPAADADDVEGIDFVRCDLREEAALAQLIDHVDATCGGLHVVVNNAGVLGIGRVDELTREAWSQVMSVNVAAPFFLTQMAVARFPTTMQAVVNVASTSAFVAGRDQVAYETSKAAIAMMTRSLAVALAPAVRVNAVAPGLVDTPMTRGLFGSTERFDARVREKIPLGRAARPSDIADAIIFLASEDAAYMTGETLVVDGGWLLI